MTSSELNYQLKHIFGGIHLENDLSLEQLENQQKKILKLREKAQSSHKKIYQSLNVIKSSILDLTDNFLTLTKGTKLSGNVMAVLSGEINSLLQNLSQQALSLSKTMQNKGESYEPNLKKIKQRYLQCAQNLDHYKKKVSLLKTNLQKQPLIKVKPNQYERVQRNYQKLLHAEKDYEKIQEIMIRRIIEFNNEGIKNIYNDFISVFSAFGSNVMIMSQKVTKYIHQSLIFRDISLPKSLSTKEIKKDVNKEADSAHKNQFLANGQNYKQYQQFVSRLINQKQIQNYLKSIICMELTRSYKTQKIQQIFNQRQTICIIHKEQETNTSYFNQFRNMYSSSTLLEQINESVALGNTKKYNNQIADGGLLKRQKQNIFSDEDLTGQFIFNSIFSTELEKKQQYIPSALVKDIDNQQKINHKGTDSSPNTIKGNSSREKKKLKFIDNKAVIQSGSEKSIESIKSQASYHDYCFQFKQKKSKQCINPQQTKTTKQDQTNFGITGCFNQSEITKQNGSTNLVNFKGKANHQFTINPSFSQKLLKYCHPSLLQQNHFQSDLTKNIPHI